jgi:hypothetical protein
MGLQGKIVGDRWGWVQERSNTGYCLKLVCGRSLVQAVGTTCGRFRDYRRTAAELQQATEHTFCANMKLRFNLR